MNALIAANRTLRVAAPLPRSFGASDCREYRQSARSRSQLDVGNGSTGGPLEICGRYVRAEDPPPA